MKIYILEDNVKSHLSRERKKIMSFVCKFFEDDESNVKVENGWTGWLSVHLSTTPKNQPHWPFENKNFLKKLLPTVKKKLKLPMARKKTKSETVL